MTWERFYRRRPSRRPTLWRSRRVGYRVRGLGKARPLTPDDGHEGSTLDGKRAHALRLGNDTGDTQTPPAVGDVAPIDGQVHELAAPAEAAPIEVAAPADALAEPLGPLPKPKARRTCVNDHPRYALSVFGCSLCPR